MTISRAYASEHFDEICERAENGEVIVLDTPGKPQLRLVPQACEEQGGTSLEAVESMLQFMRSQPRSPGKIDYHALINEGRRY